MRFFPANLISSSARATWVGRLDVDQTAFPADLPSLVGEGPVAPLVLNPVRHCVLPVHVMLASLCKGRVDTDKVNHGERDNQGEQKSFHVFPPFVWSFNSLRVEWKWFPSHFFDDVAVIDNVIVQLPVYPSVLQDPPGSEGVGPRADDEEGLTVIPAWDARVVPPPTKLAGLELHWWHSTMAREGP